MSVTADYQTVNVLTKWTFKSTQIREWVEEKLEGRVLNATAGMTHLKHDDVVRNDIDTDIDADLHVDVAELSAHLDKNSFDTIVFDPPWTLYQANLRYDGNHVYATGDNVESRFDLDKLPIETPSSDEKSQLGHARLAKDGFDYLLREGGKVVQLTYHGTCMPSRLGYERDERVVFDPIGENKAVIGSVDIKESGH